MSDASCGPTNTCQPSPRASSNSPEITGTYPGMITVWWLTRSAAFIWRRDLATRSPENLPADHAVSTLNPSASTTAR